MSENMPVSATPETTAVPEYVSPGPTFAARVDIIEKQDAMLILADLPGVATQNVDVMLEKGVLTIDGKAESPQEPGMNLDREEYEVANFHRCFSVGEGLDGSKVEALVKDGVLRLTIPKSEQYRVRRVEVKGQ